MKKIIITFVAFLALLSALGICILAEATTDVPLYCLLITAAMALLGLTLICALTMQPGASKPPLFRFRQAKLISNSQGKTIPVTSPNPKAK